jgi:PAS domain S-box-containing protein
MNRYTFREAKETILSICSKAADGEYDTREKFMAVLEENSHIAVQGYNPFGKIFFWNTASAHLYGHSEAAAVNQSLFELILPHDMQMLARAMIGCAMKTGKLPLAGPCDLVRHDGSLVTVFSGHVMFKWNEGSMPEFYCIDLAIEPETTN